MIILNEKMYAEDCLRGVFNKDKPLLSISILARYYYHCMSYSKKKVIEALMAFLEKFYPQYRYNKNYWIDNVEKVAGNAKKYPLHEIDGVPITESELTTIEGIHNKALERLAFTALCIAKLNNLRNPRNNGWINTEDREVFKLARISGTAMERRIRLGRLFRLGLLENSKRIDNLSYRVIFIDDDSPVKLYISDFRELGYEYMLYKGGNFLRCRECGILTYDNKNKTKVYCDNCRAIEPMGTKWITCSDCGEVFEVNSRNNRTKRCPACQLIANREQWRIRKQKQRDLSSVTPTKIGCS